MAVDLLKLCDPGSYFDQFLTEDVYPDGRKLNSFTLLSFKRGVCGGVGSALVRQGGVTVSCSVDASVTLRSDGPLVVPEIDFCSDFSQKAVNDIKDTLDDLMSRNLLFSRDALTCKGTEESVPLSWQLTLNIRILNSDGCVADAVVGACMAALTDVQLPHIKLNHSKEDEAPVEKHEIQLLSNTSPIALSDFAVASTFVVYESTAGKEKVSKVLCDPPLELLKLCNIKTTVVMGEKGVLLMRTRGAIADPSLIASMVQWADARRQTVVDAIRKS